jgi:hypothetical protein
LLWSSDERRDSTKDIFSSLKQFAVIASGTATEWITDEMAFRGPFKNKQSILTGIKVMMNN